MLNTNNICDGCKGTVRNATGRRLTIADLTTVHNTTCPGRHRTTNPTTPKG